MARTMYLKWKRDMTLYLRGANLWTYVLRPASPQPDILWQRKNDRIVYDGDADHDRDADQDVSHCFFCITPPAYGTPLYEHYHFAQVMNSNLNSNSHYGSS